MEERAGRADLPIESTLLSKGVLQSQGLSDARLYDWVLKRLSELFRDSGLESVVDLGAGQGELLKRIQSRWPRARLTGIDAFPAPKDAVGVEWIQANLQQLDSLDQAGAIRAIVMTETLEHVENPRSLLRWCQSQLSPGGYLLLTTPNVESWRSILSFIFRGHFVDFLDSNYPAHLTPVVSLDLKRMLHESGFEVQELTYSEWGTLPFWTRFSWNQISAGLCRGKRFGNHLMVVARKRKNVVS